MKTHASPTSRVRLGVNIDHVATLRQVRGTSYPDLVEFARECELAGAQGITVHLREDRRHVQDQDVRNLRIQVRTRLNLEMALNDDVARIALSVGPDEACIVPERRQELTTEGGLDAVACRERLARTLRRLIARGIVPSVFIEPSAPQIRAAAKAGAPAVELHTGHYCELTGKARAAELERLASAAALAHDLGLQVNAGHGLTVENVAPIAALPHMHTLNIGHSIVCRALFAGVRGAVREMLSAMHATETPA